MKPSLEIIYGIHPVTEALRAGRRSIEAVYVTDRMSSKRIAKITAKADQIGAKVESRTPAALSALAGTESHQNVAARVSRLPLCTLADLPDAAPATPPLLLLDCIQDPQNLGALMRTALAAGVAGIVIPKKRAAMPTPAVSRASAGALEHLTVACVTNLANTIDQLKKTGFWVVGLDRAGSGSIFDADLSGPLAFVIGGEQSGIRPLVKSKCDYLLHIPQVGVLDSLNASVAGAVAMYEAYRQRRRP